MSTIWNCTREEVKTSLDIKESARANAQLDELIAGSAESIIGEMKRTFAPLLTTLTFDWPDPLQRGVAPWKLWFNQLEVISIVSMTSGGVVIPEPNRFLRPDSGPPFNRLELNRDSTSAFGGGSTPQRDISMVVLQGYRNDELTAGTLAAEVSSTSATTITVSNAALIGVGQLIRIDNERMIVTGRSSTDTATNLVGTIAASLAVTTVPVQSGAAVKVGEMILLDSERMMVDDIAANNLVVRRAVDGSVLAAHTSSDVYAQRTLTVERGAQGTTAAIHSNGAAIAKWVAPSLIKQLNRAETLNGLQQEGSAYARVIGSGDQQREATGQGLADLRARARAAHGRKNRHRAV